MNNSEMIAAITAAIQTEANLVALLQAQITASLAFMATDQLQQMCQTLNIDTTESGS